MNRSNYFQWWYNLSVPSRLLMVGLAAPILVLNFWAVATIANFLGALITVIVVASLLAFLLNYPISWLVQRGARREPISIVVFLLALSLLSGLGIGFFPLVLNQAQQLIARLPDWIESGRQQLMLLSAEIEARGLELNLDVLTAQTFDRLQGQLQALTKSAINIALGTVSSLVDTLVAGVITIILTFYLVQHGDELWGSLIEWLPQKMQHPVSDTLKLSFQNYFIGQLILGICMASALIPTFLILKVPFGLLFGLTIGTMALIPFGGTVGIILVTLLVTLQNIWLGVKVLIAAVIVQQILENFVAPRILGSVTGLNPVWVFISVLMGAKVGGLIGVLVAVPTAVVIKTALMGVRSQITALPLSESMSETEVEVVARDSSLSAHPPEMSQVP
ncbi:AI-2E family transporter [Synechococcales cyanobacterium C]|uniref:AI-2E family transporter n=1 Tax=Petrachloros mirabilis ULC683 TaxID=2781853 RepID=A0A8K2A1I3_9CYAN|nr:AI-2E family transporter [Petrachloros mirabilis]NCJ08112.1 AI-2E family transporter [Petrachloros mirabilis ULC683]